MASPKTAYHYPDKFGGHRHCDMGDLKTVICQVTARDNVFKMSFDILGGSPSR